MDLQRYNYISQMPVSRALSKRFLAEKYKKVQKYLAI